MSQTSPRLDLPYIMPAQAQKHVTVNEAIRRLDALVQISVRSRTASAPPGSPGEGEAWIVPETAWEGFAGGEVAAFQDGAWARLAPGPGWLAWCEDEQTLLVHDGAGWREALGLDNLDRLGVGTQADAANPFAAKLNSALWTARETGEGGTGDLRYVMNKQGEADTASLIFQTGWEGRAEMGLAGQDDFAIKVSADGQDWAEALRIGRETGRLDARAGLAVGGLEAAAMILTPGGDGEVSIWRVSETHGENPRAAQIAGASADLLTLDAPVAGQIFDTRMEGVSMIRIWNMTRSPAEPAWAVARPSAGTLRVRDAAEIAGWQTGDQIQAGDPETVTPGRCVALDISPMLEARLGGAFPQKAVMVKATMQDGAGGDSVALTPDGSAGSFTAAVRANAGGGTAGQGVTVSACTAPSPVSQSNLVLIRETLAGQAGAALISAMAVFR